MGIVKELTKELDADKLTSDTFVGKHGKTYEYCPMTAAAIKNGLSRAEVNECFGLDYELHDLVLKNLAERGLTPTQFGLFMETWDACIRNGLDKKAALKFAAWVSDNWKDEIHQPEDFEKAWEVFLFVTESNYNWDIPFEDWAN